MKKLLITLILPVLAVLFSCESNNAISEEQVFDVSNETIEIGTSSSVESIAKGKSECEKLQFFTARNLHKQMNDLRRVPVCAGRGIGKRLIPQLKKRQKRGTGCYAYDLVCKVWSKEKKTWLAIGVQ